MKYEFKEEDAYRFAREQGIEVKRSGNQLHFKTCPYCKPKATKGNVRTFAIELADGQFNCFRASCKATGNMLTLARDFDFSLGTEVDEYYHPKKQYRQLKQPKEKILPKSPAISYLESRKISQKVAEEYEITTQSKDDTILVFPFFNEKGIMQFVKYRRTDYNPDKHKGFKEWCEKDCKPILFGMKQCNDKFDRLIITEGQLDSLSVATAGIENAVSVPTGAKGFTWVPYCWEWVRKFEEIVVFGDFEKGKMTLLEEIKHRFPNKIKYVREQDYQGCKDANEILQKYGTEAIQVAIKNAVMIPIKRVLPLAEVESVNIYELPKLKTGIFELDRTLYGGLPFGTVCLLSGKRGQGKSTFGSQIMANAIEQGYSIFTYSGELPNYLYKSWFDFQIAGRNHIIENQTKFNTINRFISNQNQALINAWYQDKAYIYDSRIIENDEKEELLKTLTKAIMQYGIKVILIDNLMSAMYIDERQGTTKYEQQGEFVNKLCEIAVKYNVLIILVAHRRKNTFSQDINDEVEGSGDITNLAGVILGYDSGSKDEITKGIMKETQRKLTISKNRIFGITDTKGKILSYDEKSKRIYGLQDDVNSQFGWDKDGFTSVENMEIPF